MFAVPLRKSTLRMLTRNTKNTNIKFINYLVGATAPQGRNFSIWDNYKDYTYVGTLDGLYQHTLIATGTRLRPVEATFLGHMFDTKPAQNMRV